MLHTSAAVEPLEATTRLACHPRALVRNTVNRLWEVMSAIIRYVRLTVEEIGDVDVTILIEDS